MEARLFDWESDFVPLAISYHKRGWSMGKMAYSSYKVEKVFLYEPLFYDDQN